MQEPGIICMNCMIEFGIVNLNIMNVWLITLSLINYVLSEELFL